MVIPVPQWDSMGVIPPIDLADPTSADRSPYNVSLIDLIKRYSTSPKRIEILQGFLNYRAALHRMGLVAGFQWLDGSFIENVELIEGRDPKDIDVVTFVDNSSAFIHPTGSDINALDHDMAKLNYLVDSFFVEIDKIDAKTLIELSTYWYSMWSHRRDFRWKGFLQIDLNSADDTQANTLLSSFGGIGLTS